MKFLYVPWRSKYIKKQGLLHFDDKSEHCIFCIKFNENKDRENFILARLKYHVIILNLHPYNTGHIMILPLKHIKKLNDMEVEARFELIELTNHSINILEEQLKCEGINFGINLGKPAGGSVPNHLHLHIIPRWQGDTNFLPIIADVKIISFDLNKIYDDLKPKFENLQKGVL